MKAKILSLEEALQMYDLIGAYLPTEPIRGIDAISAMVSKMGGEKYFKCLELLTGESKETLVKSEKNDRLSVFIVGFQSNRLFELPRLKADGLHG